MLTLVGGIVSLILAFLALIFWWEPFVIVIKAGIPLLLLFGGLLATYLGLEEWKEAQNPLKASGCGPGGSEAEKYKAEVERYKKELAALRETPKEGPGQAEED